MDKSLLQVLLALAMFATTAVSGFLPIKILKMLTAKNGEPNDSGAKWLSLMSCFSGGVFLATCFLDVIPHIAENYSELIEESRLDFKFPLPYMFICMGFFLVYFIEEICMKIFSMEHYGHSHNEQPGPVVRTHSDRNLRDQVLEESVKYMAGPDEGSFLKSATFAVAMSFHSILEGFALGVQSTTHGIVTLFISLILHKAIEAFSVGLQISKGNANRIKVVLVTIFVYACMTPIGSLLGTFLQHSSLESVHKLGTIVVLEGLAAGTFIYVTFLEVLAHEKSNEHDSLKQLFAIFCGYTVIAMLQFFFSGHSHGAEHAGHH